MDDSALPRTAISEEAVNQHHRDQPTHRAAIYARTSTTRQKLGYSIDEQVRQCVQRCLSFDWTIAFVFRDEATSGKDTDRSMFQEMLTQAKNGLIDVVVFWKLDRFSRSIMHAVQLEKQFREWRVALHSVTEQIDTTTPSGQFNFRNLANTAEFEREMIRQRTKMGHAARAMEGKWPNGTPPLGYTLNSDGRLQTVESESKVVHWIFNRYTETQSMARVADELNEERVDGSNYKKWTPAAVGEILRNKIYVGKYQVGETERTETSYRIIPEDVFEEVQVVRTRFRSSEPHSRDSMSLPRKKKRIQRVLDQYHNWIQANAEAS